MNLPVAQINKKHGRVKKVTPLVDAITEPATERSILERILSSIPDGRVAAISYARQLAFKDARYRELIHEFDKDKKTDLGHLCQRHEIAPQDFLADVNREAYPVIEEAMNFARGIAQGIVAERLPKVVSRGMIEGGKADGVADRHFTLQKEGFHVAPKGMAINLTQVNQQAAGLSDFSDDVKEMASILGEDEPLSLEAADDDTDYIDAEIEERVAV